jgi:hypothetical protein
MVERLTSKEMAAGRDLGRLLYYGGGAGFVAGFFMGETLGPSVAMIVMSFSVLAMNIGHRILGGLRTYDRRFLVDN